MTGWYFNVNHFCPAYNETAEENVRVTAVHVGSCISTVKSLQMWLARTMKGSLAGRLASFPHPRLSPAVLACDLDIVQTKLRADQENKSIHFQYAPAIPVPIVNKCLIPGRPQLVIKVC